MSIDFSYKNVRYVSEQCVFRQIAIDVHELNSKLKYQERMILELKEEVEKLRTAAKNSSRNGNLDIKLRSTSDDDHDDRDDDVDYDEDDDRGYLPPVHPQVVSSPVTKKETPFVKTQAQLTKEMKSERSIRKMLAVKKKMFTSKEKM